MTGPAMYALNFYSPLVADQLRTGRKSATIRLGDKSSKYKKGMIVQVLCGSRYSPRERIFDAVIDKVEVKTLGELSPREIEHDNPEIRRTDEMATFLGQLYNREISHDDQVTVIRFSQILTGPVAPTFLGENDLF
ncbi:MAG TPA: ASCH domain-containing protein [Gaiellaceae bacterium]|nr:ASCH domain-containing protein [Gaiellaceae bacterium]